MYKLLFKQKNKELYSAEFEILENNNVIGNVYVKGKLGSMYVNIVGTFRGEDFSLVFANEILKYSSKKSRRYNIIENNNVVGEIFQTVFKKNIFSGYSYIDCKYYDEEFKLYTIGLGNKCVRVIYKDDVQISQIGTSNIVYNELYDFDIYFRNKKDDFISVLLNCYIYGIGFFKPGVKVTKSVVKRYYKSFNKDLIAKYNSDWIKEDNDNY